MLSAEEARTLQRLVLLGGGTASGAGSGSRHARSRGLGSEFHDYRRYQPGDDPRTIDWTVEARLRQLVVRVCQAEGHLRVHLLVDVSGSMAVGTPSKLACASKVAAALCYLAIERRDSVGIATFDDAIRTHLRPATGRHQVFRVFDVLRHAAPAGRSRIDRALTDFTRRAREGGMAIVLSDFFQRDGVLDGLRYLRSSGLALAVLQIVAPEELRPSIVGEVELADIEDPATPAVTVDRAAVSAYQQRVSQTSAALAAFCAERGMPWAQVQSSTSFEGLVEACVKARILGGHA